MKIQVESEDRNQKKTKPMTKRYYKLLKDVVTMDLVAKAGDIGELGQDGKVWFDNGRYWYSEKKISEWPEWFQSQHKCPHCGCMTFQPNEECWNYPNIYSQPKTEEPTPFQWTDKDMISFVAYSCGVGKSKIPLGELLEEFKQSRTNATEQPK